MGGTQGDSGNALVLDSNGNIYVTGTTSGGGSSDSWGTPLRPFASNDAWVAKFNNNGSLIWNTFVGGFGSGRDEGMGISLDDAGNPIVVGQSDRAWGDTFSPTLPDINLLTPYHGGQDAFVLKLDSDGAIDWLTFVGGGLDEDPHKVATLNSNGNIVVSGSSNGSWGNPIRGYTAGTDTFVASLSSEGALQWNTFLGGTGTEFLGKVAVDSTDNLYVTLGSRISWGTPIVAPAGFNDIVLVKMNSSGVIEWSTFAGSSGNENGEGIDIDSEGNVYVSGTSNSGPFGPVTVPPTTPKVGGFDVFAAKFAPDGALLANNFVGSTFSDTGTEIAVDANGDIINIGNARAWGEPIVSPVSTVDGFISKICSSCVTVTASSDAFGTASRQLTAVEPGGTALISVSPGNGYITDTTVGGTCATGSFNGSVYTTGVITVGCTVTFTHSTYNVSAFIEDNGSVSPASVTTSSGNAVSFTVSPDSGYFVTNTQVFGNCPAGSWAGNVYTTGITSAPCTIFFEPQLIIVRATGTVDDNGRFLFFNEGGTEQMETRSAILGDSVTFTIEPNQGFATSMIVGGDCPAGSFNNVQSEIGLLQQYTTGSLTADCNLSFTHTALEEFTVNASSDAGGSISNPETQVFQGDQAEVSISTNAGFRIDQDNVGGSCPIGSFDIGDVDKTSGITQSVYTSGEISENCTIVINHEEILSFTVSATVDEFGTLNTSSVTVLDGEVASFELTSDFGYTVNVRDGGITGDCAIGRFGFGELSPSTASSRDYFTGEINSDCTVNFIHSLLEHDVELIDEAENISITPSESFNLVTHGESLAFTMIADEGFAPLISGSCGGVLVGDVYTTSPVTSDCSVIVEQVPAEFVISTLASAQQGAIFPESASVGSGQMVGFNVTPAEGFRVLDVTGCGGTWSGENPYITGPATESCTVTPSFERINDGECDFYIIKSEDALAVVCL